MRSAQQPHSYYRLSVVKIKPLILMLGSPADGERLAATYALERTLNASGHDLHDLAAALDAPSEPEREPSWRDTVRWLLDNPEQVNDWERRFLRSLLRFRELSEKQRAVLFDIHDRVQGVATNAA